MSGKKNERLAKHIGGRLQRLRKGIGITQDDLSERIGISRQCIGFLERGDSMPTADTIWRMSQYFQVSPGIWFLGYTNSE